MKKINLVLIFLISTLLSFNPAFGAQLKVFIHYDVEIDARSFMQAEPVIIQLIISNPDAMNAYYHNLAQGKEEEKIETVTLGAENKPWINSVKFKVTDSKGKEAVVNFFAQAPEQNQVTLRAENAAESYFFISPDETKKLKPGDYTIEAAFGEAVSKALELKIVEGKKPVAKDNIAHLLKFGRYHLLLGKFTEAKIYADQILAIEPHNLQGLNLLGDVQTGLGQYKEAYATFQKAINEFFRQYPPDGTGTYEPPELLIDKAYKLKNKLKSK